MSLTMRTSASGAVVLASTPQSRSLHYFAHRGFADGVTRSPRWTASLLESLILKGNPTASKRFANSPPLYELISTWNAHGATKQPTTVPGVLNQRCSAIRTSAFTGLTAATFLSVIGVGAAATTANNVPELISGLTIFAASAALLIGGGFIFSPRLVKDLINMRGAAELMQEHATALRTPTHIEDYLKREAKHNPEFLGQLIARMNDTLKFHLRSCDAATKAEWESIRRFSFASSSEEQKADLVSKLTNILTSS